MQNHDSSEDDLIHFLTIKKYENQYQKTAKKIYKIIGKNNYKKVWHCSTRLRLDIINKEDINEDEIKEISLVKGVNWNGNQLQIIIGNDVSKLLEAFENLKDANYDNEQLEEEFKLKQLKNNIRNNNKKQKFLAMFSGILSSNIPVLMIGGMIAAIQAILIQAGVIVSISNMQQVGSYDLLSGIMYVMSKTLMNGIGMFFLYNTVKYLGGNPLYAISIGMILLSRGLYADLHYGDGAWVKLEDAQAGDWITDPWLGKQGWLLFKVDIYPVVVGGYEQSLLPFLAAGFVLVYLDRLTKTWFPKLIEWIFRPTLMVLVTVISIWFIFGPILGIIEYGIGYAVGWMSTGIPYGIGVGIFAALWQPLVVTGMHRVVSYVGIVQPMLTGASSQIACGIMVGVFAQVGAGVGVMLKSKNAQIKSVAAGGVVAGIFGITEPIIFGINLPRLKPFFIGIGTAFVIGVISGLIGIDADIAGNTAGIFSILNLTGSNKYDALTEQGLGAMLWALDLGLAALVTYLLYNDKVNEYRGVKKAINKALNITSKVDPNINKMILGKNFENDLLAIKNIKPLINEKNKALSLNSKYQQQLINLDKKESAYRENLYKKLTKLQIKIFKMNLAKTSKEKLDKSLVKFKLLEKKYESYNLENKKDLIHKKIEENNLKSQNLIKKVDLAKQKIYESLTKKINQNCGSIINNKKIIEVINNMIFNSINADEINYNLAVKKPANLKNELKQRG